MAKVTASLITRSASLAEEFGLNYAIKLFGEEFLADVPRYQRGPKKGQIKAYLTWVKAESGGWNHEYGVCRPGLVRAWIAAGYCAPQTAALRGMWMGRIESLCGSRSVLSPEYRAQEMQRRADQAAELSCIARAG